MSEALPREVGRAIRVMRMLRGLSFAEFAEKARLSATYLRQVERGERDVGIGALANIAEGLDCDPRLLLPGDGHSAVAWLVAGRFDVAPEAVQDAILFLLLEPEASPRKQAILALMSTDVARYGLRPRAEDRAGASSSSSSGRRPRR